MKNPPIFFLFKGTGFCQLEQKFDISQSFSLESRIINSRAYVIYYKLKILLKIIKVLYRSAAQKPKIVTDSLPGV